MTIAQLGIVMPAYNAAKWIAPALRSVCKQQLTNGGGWKLVVVDDGSEDDTMRVAVRAAGRESRIELLRSGSHLGFAHAVNLGMAALATPKEASPGWVMVMGADDTIAPTFVLAAYQTIAQAPRAACFYPWVYEFGVRGTVWVNDYRPGQLRDRNIIPGCAIWSRDVWDALGGYDPEFHGVDDWHLNARAELAGIFARRPPAVMPGSAPYYSRAHPSSATARLSDERRAALAQRIAALYAAPTTEAVA